MKHPALHLTAILLFLALASLPAHAIAPAYTVTDLGDLAGYGSQAWGVNDSGQVVGYSYTGDGSTYHAFLWQAGSGMTDLGTFGGAWSRGAGINNIGQVAGTAEGTTTNRAFLWQAGSGMTDLGALSGGSSVGWAINNLGQVVGSSQTPTGAYHPFLWTPGSGMLDMGINDGTARAVNDSAQVAGEAGDVAFFWESVTGVAWVTQAGAVRVRAYDINNAGKVAGYSDLYDENYQIVSHAFIWDRTTGMHELGALSGGSGAYAINNLGQVVGWTGVPYDTIPHAFVWEEGLGMVDLNERIVGSPTYKVSGARSISDTGYIVGYGRNAGQWRALLLSPVPEPAGLLVLGSGTATLLLVIRRRK